MQFLNDWYCDELRKRRGMVMDRRELLYRKRATPLRTDASRLGSVLLGSLCGDDPSTADASQIDSSP
jgi:hypothetical protein